MERVKKSGLTENAKTQQKEWNTLHIFGYGETQVNGSVNRKVATTSLTKVQAVIDYVYSLKPADNNAGSEYHSITIVKNVFARFTPKTKEEQSYSIAFKDLDASVINGLVDEIKELN